MLAIVILAAGESRRMGQPKALIPFPDFASPSKKNTNNSTGRKTFLCHLIEVTRHPRTAMLRVVVGAHAEQIRTDAKLDADELVVNENWKRGQLSSLQAAIRSLPAGATEGILICLVDHPLISAELVSRLIEAFEHNTNKVVIPTYQGRRGHPVIFPAALYDELLAAPEEIGARAVVHAHAKDVLELPVKEEGVVLNLNDQESLRRIASKKVVEEEN